MGVKQTATTDKFSEILGTRYDQEKELLNLCNFAIVKFFNLISGFQYCHPEIGEASNGLSWVCQYVFR